MKKKIALICTVTLLAIAVVSLWLYIRTFNTLITNDININHPFDLRQNWITLTAKLNDQPCSILFDTGTVPCLIDSSAATAMGIKGLPIIRTTLNYRDTVQIGIIKEVRIGTIVLRNVTALICQFPTMIANAAPFIMGTRLIGQMNWDFDFDSGAVNISSQAIKTAVPCSRIKMSNSTQPSISFTIAPNEPAEAMLDFGFTEYITLPMTHTSNSNTHAIPNSSQRLSIHGQYTRLQYEASGDICLGNDTLRDVRITYTDDPPPLLGLGLIRRYHRCILNFSTHEMLLLPSRSF